MKAQAGQIKDLKKNKVDIQNKTVSIIAEAGLDKGTTFMGAFLAKVGSKHYKIEDGVLTKIL